MQYIEKIFYINLLNRPDRNLHFLNSCEKVGIPKNKIERYEAIDGTSYIPTLFEEKLFFNCDYKNKKYYKKILSNQLGHYNLLKIIIERKYKYSIICQDDVYFRDDFLEYLDKIINNIPEDAEIINIGLHKYANYNLFQDWNLNNTPFIDYQLIGKIKINDYVCKLKDNINPCSLAYIVKLEGAINLIKYFDTNGFIRATDGNFNDYCLKKNIFYCSIPVLATGNSLLGSDIFT